eukprot:11102670-Alexandrium_andersonii.AAC.1
MSASLVGSEMCIRDSRLWCLNVGTRSTEGTASEGRVIPKAAADLSGGTVSYTHLTLPTICSV